MFESITPAPPDPILGITEAFQRDERPDKINLSVGVYKDETGRTPILRVVKEAERRLVETESSKSYKPIPGDAEYSRLVRELLFSPSGGESAVDSAALESRAVTAHAPGGTGALRVVADFLRDQCSGVTVWMSDPTWVNHPKVFAAAGLASATYPYFDRTASALDLNGMLTALRAAPPGDVVLLHGCCHNPSGVDPTEDEWNAIADVVAERELIPLVDFAYQGFGVGIDEDAAGLIALLARCPELIICSSFSKTFGLYSERVGALTMVAGSEEAAAAVFSRMKTTIRVNYSNPPAHGAAIVRTVLGDAELRSGWIEELDSMRGRIHAMRDLFATKLEERGVPGDHSFLRRQRGMFSFSRLSKEQVERLREEHAVYIVGSGRINVAGITPANVDQLADAIAAVS